MHKNPTIFFILHLPPPVHGASMVGKYIKDSAIINSSFDCKYVNLALAKDLNDIGKGSIYKISFFFSKLKTIYKMIKKEKPSLIYITPNAKGGAFYKDFIVMMLLKSMNQKIVAHYHNKGISSRQDRFVDNLLYKQFFSDIKVILLAESLYKDFQKYVDRNSLAICPNGMPATVEKGDLPAKDANKKFTILFLSNMMTEKGVWDLLEACQLLKDKHLPFQCNFVGKWSDITKKTFFDKVKDYNLEDCVVTHGAKYGKEKQQFFEEADLFVFPTYYHNESFPLVLLEAMEYQVACVSTDEGGIPDIIDNERTGFLVKKKNPEYLAIIIEQMIKNRSLCWELGLKGREKFEEKYTLDVFEQKMKMILQECIDE